MKIFKKIIIFLLVQLLFLSALSFNSFQLLKSSKRENLLKDEELKELLSSNKDTLEFYKIDNLIDQGIDDELKDEIEEYIETFVFESLLLKEKNPEEDAIIDKEAFKEILKRYNAENFYSETELEAFEEYINESLNLVFKNSYYDSYQRIRSSENLNKYLLASIIVLALLIVLIDFNLLSSFKRFISISGSLIFVLLVTKVSLRLIVFKDSFLAAYLNLALKRFEKLVDKALMINMFIAFIIVVLIIISTVIFKSLSKKKGIKTLDNFLDDYDEAV